MKFAAAMTLYNPDGEYIENIKNTLECFEILYINDNTSDNSEYVSEIQNLKGVVYLWNGHNDGLPVAFNRMLTCAYKDNVDYLCTLDQDSVLIKENVDKVKQYIRCNDMSEIAAVGMLPKEKCRVMKHKEVEIEKVDWILCSGCFLNLAVISENKIKYDEAYFVDRFDADICMQIKRKGLKIIRLNNAVFWHRCGDDNGEHSELRNYYIFRNRYYFNYKYYSWVVAGFRTFLQTLRHKKWIYKDAQSVERRKIILKTAIEDFCNGNMGEITKDSYCKMFGTN